MILSSVRRTALSGKRRICTAAAILYLLACFGTVCALSHDSGYAFGPITAVSLFLGTAVVSLLLIPPAAIQFGNACRPRDAQLRLLPPGSLSGDSTRRFVRVLPVALIICAGPCAAALVMRALFGGIPAWDIARTSLAVLMSGVSALALGWYCSVLCRDVFSAAGLSLFVILLVCTEPVWIGPVIDSTSNVSMLIQSSLVANPLAGVAAALNFDIFRTEPLYQICPFGQRRFTYPPWYAAPLFHGLASLFLLWRSSAGIRRQTGPSVIEHLEIH